MLDPAAGVGLVPEALHLVPVAARPDDLDMPFGEEAARTGRHDRFVIGHGGIMSCRPPLPQGLLDIRRDLLEKFASSLSPEDIVVVEATGNASAVSAVIAPHVKRVAIANPKQVKIIAHAKIKTDTIDACTDAVMPPCPANSAWRVRDRMVCRS